MTREHVDEKAELAADLEVELTRLSFIVAELTAMTNAEIRRSLAYLNDRFGHVVDKDRP